METWDDCESEDEDTDEGHANEALMARICTYEQTSEDELTLDNDSYSDNDKDILLMMPLKHHSWYLDSGCL